MSPITGVSILERWQLAVTVRTYKAKVLANIVRGVTVYMVSNKYKLLALPGVRYRANSTEAILLFEEIISDIVWRLTDMA